MNPLQVSISCFTGVLAGRRFTKFSHMQSHSVYFEIWWNQKRLLNTHLAHLVKKPKMRRFSIQDIYCYILSFTNHYASIIRYYQKISGT